MPLTLEQYTSYLDTRSDLPWPAPPEATPVKARPHLERLDGVRAVLWNVYGTLLAIPLGDIVFEHPQAFIMSNALEKTIQEFKMWLSMTRKPGQPSEALRVIYDQVLMEQRGISGPGGEKHPEVLSERVWESILKKLMQKDYKFDATFFGSLNEYSRKIAYFFHTSLQGTACYDGAAEALRYVHEAGLKQGLLADAQSFTTVQLQRGLDAQGGERLDELLTDGLVILSCDARGRKPSDRLYKQALAALREKGIEPEEVLHVGSRIAQDVIPARRLGMRTALFAGDKVSLQATPEQLKEPSSRPDVLLTELSQIVEVVVG
jgi:FMN phosphatase YigB (HAD superfamily)